MTSAEFCYMKAFYALGNVLKSKPRKWPWLSVCLMNDEEKNAKTSEYFISVSFFL